MATQGETSSWFRRFGTVSRRPRWRLLCLPYAGGSARVFQSWPRYLAADVELLAVQYPGREDRYAETASLSLTTLATTIASHLGGLPVLPYIIFGHSLGALVGFELTREIARRELPRPTCLVVSGSSGPRINTHRGNPRHTWPDDAFVGELSRMGGTPKELLDNSALMALMLPTLRADLGMVDTYDYVDDAPLELPVHAMGGLDDGDVSRAKLERWSDETAGGFTMTMFAGDHFFIHECAAPICTFLGDRMDLAP